MTIAISAVVKPSRLLVLSLATLCACAAVVGVAVGFGLVGELSVWARLVCALSCIVTAGGGLAHAIRQQKNYHLDIGGSGQIRLRRIKDFSDGGKPNNIAPDESGMLVTLLADSTVWPQFLMLRLQDDSGRVYALPILPDSLPVQSFRALRVACRWIAAHRFSEFK